MNRRTLTMTNLLNLTHTTLVEMRAKAAACHRVYHSTARQRPIFIPALRLGGNALAHGEACGAQAPGRHGDPVRLAPVLHADGLHQSGSTTSTYNLTGGDATVAQRSGIEPHKVKGSVMHPTQG